VRAGEASSFAVAMARLRAALLECAERDNQRVVNREDENGHFLPPLSHPHLVAPGHPHGRDQDGAFNRGDEVHRQYENGQEVLGLPEWRQPTPLHHRLIPASRQRHRTHDRCVQLSGADAPTKDSSLWAWVDAKPEVRRVYSSLPLVMRRR